MENCKQLSDEVYQYALLKDERTTLDNVHKSITFPNF